MQQQGIEVSNIIDYQRDQIPPLSIYKKPSRHGTIKVTKIVDCSEGELKQCEGNDCACSECFPHCLRCNPKKCIECQPGYTYYEEVDKCDIFSEAFSYSFDFSKSEFFSESLEFTKTTEFTQSTSFSISFSFSVSYNFTPTASGLPPPVEIQAQSRDGVFIAIGSVCGVAVVVLVIVIIVILIRRHRARNAEDEDSVDEFKETVIPIEDDEFVDDDDSMHSEERDPFFVESNQNLGE